MAIADEIWRGNVGKDEINEIDLLEVNANSDSEFKMALKSKLASKFKVAPKQVS
jgi:hypothetical protein